jgi:hypothetical protein
VTSKNFFFLLVTCHWSLVTAFKLLSGIHRETRFIPGVIAAEERGCVFDTLRLEIKHRTGA